jgi:cation diffusion facilitator CzcD-associated flavoprotein CzcO
MDGDRQHVRIAIIGAGFGGLGAAIRLKRELTSDFLVFEQADDVGGTWQANTYPGCTCDVPSHLYSFSFALNPQWTRSFSGQAEIWAYLRDCVTRFGLAPHLRLGHRVTAVTWDEDNRQWLVDTSRGDYRADVVIAAPGPLSEPALPKLPGLDSFTGTVFHSARWDHGHDLTGRRVAVIGTGASAVQFVPRIQPRVERLVVFQRTPPWILPRADRALTRAEHRLYAALPAAQRLTRGAIFWSRELSAFLFLHPPLMRFGEAIARRHLARQVPDPALRAKLWPAYTMGCKRVLLSSDYLPALARPNVTLETDPIAEVTPGAVVTASGTVHQVDTIICGTGFHVTDQTASRVIRGRGGQSLEATWQGSPKAYLGTAVTGFPNLFLLLGPNSGLGQNSVVFMIEAQLEHILRGLRHMDRRGLATVEPTAAAQASFVSEVDNRMRDTVWIRGGCHSWYLDGTGRNSTIWPNFSWRYRWRLRRFRPDAYATTAAS